MHTFGDTGAGVPAFLAKLWRLVEDPETNDLIYWSTDGRSFIIQNQARFAKELLPLNYKHNNMASFIRQLNMYGFHKITSIDNGGLRFDRDEMEFSHPCFQKGHPYLLEHIKRKIAHPKVTDSKESVKIEAVNKMLCEVKTMRGRQDALDSRFSSMKQENEALWREVAILRQKHMKQQQIVNKLIQFLVTMVQPSRSGLSGMGRRRYQLMINDAPRSSKVWLNNIIDILGQRSASPIIHELEEELLDEVANNDDTIISDFPHVASPEEDDDNSGEISNGRKSTDYVVDHVDDYDLGQTSPATAFEDGQQRKRSYSGGEEAYGAKKVIRQQVGSASVHDAQQSLIGAQRVKQEKDLGYGKVPAVAQQSLLKGQKPVTTNKKTIKQEKDLYSYGKHENSVPDITTTNASTQGAATSPSSSNGSGKSFYSKDDLFTDDVPNELFGDDANTLLTNDEAPLLGGAGTVDLNTGIIYDSNPPMVTIPSDKQQEPGTSTNNQSVVLSDGSNMQIAKFSGKSNQNDISKLTSHSEYDSHLNDVQTDLDALKDILRGDNYQFDSSALLNNLGDPSNYNRYFMPSPPMDPAMISKLFNTDDIIAYEMPTVNDAASVATVLPGAPSPGTTAALTEYAPDVDLSELLELPSSDYSDNNQQAITGTRN